MDLKSTKVFSLGLAAMMAAFSMTASATLSVRTAFQDAAVSVDGASDSVGALQVDTPAGATVLGAYLYTASVWTGPADGPVSLAGNTLTNGDPEDLGLLTPDDNPANTRLYDVTDIMKPLIEGTNGLQSFAYTEGSTLDGAVLAVIYQSAETAGGTAIIMDGELALGGDSTTLTFESPYTGGDVIMSLASSFSFNGSTDSNVTGQVTNVDVTTDSTDNRRLTSCAGGHDDAGFSGGNGSLITVGGIDDDSANPDPNCAGGGGDDELYNLALGNSDDATPFLQNGDTFVTFDTENPSFDDNVFFLAFTTDFTISEVDDIIIDDGGDNPPSSSVPEPSTLSIYALGLLAFAYRRRLMGQRK